MVWCPEFWRGVAPPGGTRKGSPLIVLPFLLFEGTTMPPACKSRATVSLLFLVKRTQRYDGCRHDLRHCKPRFTIPDFQRPQVFDRLPPKKRHRAARGAKIVFLSLVSPTFNVNVGNISSWRRTVCNVSLSGAFGEKNAGLDTRHT
jgi:hypothetical protein